MDKATKEFSENFDKSWTLRNNRKAGKSYIQAFELFKFMKTSEIGKRISIVSPEGNSTWERVE